MGNKQGDVQKRSVRKSDMNRGDDKAEPWFRIVKEYMRMVMPVDQLQIIGLHYDLNSLFAPDCKDCCVIIKLDQNTYCFIIHLVRLKQFKHVKVSNKLKTDFAKYKRLGNQLCPTYCEELPVVGRHRDPLRTLAALALVANLYVVAKGLPKCLSISSEIYLAMGDVDLLDPERMMPVSWDEQIIAYFRTELKK